ncbi:hypothetical protein [Guptibacillus spartinae]|uniref:hypothetical protein n=1 Tax=Guptibacillus spartinae TaxID=3025679 RepID=UPI002361F901|nr:hypothetical protein [Pseudalkalibacillus spartinae]
MYQDDIDKILKESSLYDRYEITSQNKELLNTMFKDEVTIDTYCKDCGKESTFKAKMHNSQLKTINGLTKEGIGRSHLMGSTVSEDGTVDVQEDIDSYILKRFWNNVAPLVHRFTCQRDESHKMFFIFLVRDNALMKIGQYPSTATIDNADLQKYRKILGNDKYKELSKGVGLASHGVGIGSFVYLRRIFEGLIEESHHKAKNELSDWNEDDYRQARMNERIKLLEDYLPPFLVENSVLYGILSKGVHELDEDTCLQMFPNIQVAIEIILDEKIAEREKESKLKKASRFLKETHENFK